LLLVLLRLLLRLLGGHEILHALHLLLIHRTRPSDVAVRLRRCSIGRLLL
jgi:hypothetical protein